MRYGAPRNAGDSLDRLGEVGVVAVVRSPSSHDALTVARVLVAAGIGAVEITWTTPSAATAVRALRDEFPAVLLGAGSLRTPAHAAEAAAAGADFLVSAGSPPTLVSGMLDTGRLVLPGVFTPTEIMAAADRGVAAAKLFPALAHGPSGLAALRGPFPDVAFVPTGGVGIEDVGAWLAAGAHAVGLGSALAPARITDAEHALRVGDRARAVTGAIRT
jgi:2-dehydro-3-deoxyphosphogluconate aldolase/(4S)-4-hydroxy-2-oxoglutarate aldolase